MLPTRFCFIALFFCFETLYSQFYLKPTRSYISRQKERQQKIQRENNRMLRNLLEVDPSRRAERKQRFSRSKASENATGTLNLVNRQKQLQKITEENKKLLEVI